MKFFVALLALFLIIGTATAEVKSLNKKNFDSALKDVDFALVKFYAPWCGHCKQLAPEYEKAATMLEGKATLAEVNCDDEKELASRFKVQGFPTLIIFRNGEESSQYDGPRDAAGIAAHVKSLLGPSVKTIASQAELDSLKGDGLPTCVIKTKDASSELAKILTGIAHKMRSSVSFALVTDAAISPADAMESVTVYRGTEAEDKETYSGAIEAAAIQEFLDLARVPIFGEINPSTFQMYASITKVPLGWVFLSKDTPEELKTTLIPVAKKYRKDLIIAWLNADLYGGVGQQMALPKDVEYPAFVIDIDRMHHIMPRTPKISEKNMPDFIEKYLRGEVKPTMMSDPAPEKDTVDGLTTIVGTTLENYVPGKKDVLLLFYAPWCGHCKTLHPIYEKLAKSMESTGVIIAKMDATTNDFDRKKYTVQGFPTMYFIPAGQEPIPYNGERTLEAMKTFLNEHKTAATAEEAPKKEESDVDGDL